MLSNRIRYFTFILLNFTFQFAFSQDKTTFNIDTLRAIWKSGSGIGQVKGDIYLSMKIPAGLTATLRMKTNPTGNYNPAGTFGDITTTTTQRVRATIPNLRIRDDIYCFYLDLKNGNNTIATKELCSIPFTKDMNNSVENRLVFQVGSYQPGTAFPFGTFRPVITGKCESAPEICTDDEDTFATNTKAVPPYTARKEYNSIVKCGEVKAYQAIIDVDGDGFMISISDTIVNKGFTKQIPAILLEDWAFATIENDKVKLVWKNSPLLQGRTGTTINDYTLESKFILERKEGVNGNFVQMVSSPELERNLGDSKKFSWEYIDATSQPSKNQYFYRMKYEDYCANISPPINIFPIFFSQDKNTFELVWNDENNNKLVDYEVEFFDLPNIEVRKTILVTPKANKYKAETSNFYRLKGKQINGDGSYIYSNFIPNDENLTVLNPNVFTPDGKGPAESETFKVTTQAAKAFSIVIYNREGLLVYFSDNYEAHRKNGWDGKLIYTDWDLPEGVYAFQVEVINSNNKSFTKRGSVVLVRN